MVNSRQINSKNGMHVARLLRARGFEILACNPDDQLLTSINTSEQVLNRFYKKLGKYSFRLFLRELLENQNYIRPENVSRYCSGSAAIRYLEFLLQIGLVKQEFEHYRLQSETVPNFGETLEWYIAELFKREFGANAVYRATLTKSKIGGDFDVLVDWIGKLIYLEVKSSPPKAVDASQVQMFFNRIWELLPELAIFLEDTQLRMFDKIVPLFREELARHYGKLGHEEYPILRLQDEIFHINHNIYIMNSKRGLVQNLTVCLRDFLRNQQLQLGMP